jgi:putative addiction module CopG family antidote
MPKNVALKVSLDSRSAKLTKRLVESGRYASPDDVARAAMRLLEAEERERAAEIEAIRLGIEDMRAGRTRSLEDVFADLERKYPDVPKRRASRGA